MVALDREGFDDPFTIFSVDSRWVLYHRTDEVDIFRIETTEECALLNFRDFHDYFLFFVYVVVCCLLFVVCCLLPLPVDIVTIY